MLCYISALLVASRMHEFSRSVRQIIKVAKVCDTTIRKRYILLKGSFLFKEQYPLVFPISKWSKLLRFKRWFKIDNLYVYSFNLGSV